MKRPTTREVLRAAYQDLVSRHPWLRYDDAVAGVPWLGALGLWAAAAGLRTAGLLPGVGAVLLVAFVSYPSAADGYRHPWTGASDGRDDVLQQAFSPIKWPAPVWFSAVAPPETRPILAPGTGGVHTRVAVVFSTPRGLGVPHSWWRCGTSEPNRSVPPSLQASGGDRLDAGRVPGEETKKI